MVVAIATSATQQSPGSERGPGTTNCDIEMPCVRSATLQIIRKGNQCGRSLDTIHRSNVGPDLGGTLGGVWGLRSGPRSRMVGSRAALILLVFTSSRYSRNLTFVKG